MVVVGRHLHGELALGSECGDPSFEHRTMVGHPLQRGVGEDEVVVGIRRPTRDVTVRIPVSGRSRWPARKESTGIE